MNADEFARFVLALPGVTQHIHESSIGFRVRGKGFSYLAEEPPVALIKATREERAALIAESREVYSRSHTQGRFGWVQVELERADEDEVTELVTEAWRLTAPKSLR